MNEISRYLPIDVFNVMNKVLYLMLLANNAVVNISRYNYIVMVVIEKWYIVLDSNAIYYVRLSI